MYDCAGGFNPVSSGEGAGTVQQPQQAHWPFSSLLVQLLPARLLVVTYY